MAKIAIGNSASVSSNLAWMLKPELWQHAFAEPQELGNRAGNITDAAQPELLYVGASAAHGDDWTSIFANGPFAACAHLNASLPYSSPVMGECY
jgi:hypothetical protein